MPTLDWIGKDKVVNHHLDVPYRVLERKYSFDSNGQHIEDNHSENMIIHGDNLEALKSLLPKYEGRIDCIYIDPPYNTGKEKWIYNDNVNDPQIKKWLGEVVGSESEDLSRHDKWLCMMYPRLRLLHKLLKINGCIFISMKFDCECSNLKNICDEIFGRKNFISELTWESTTQPINSGSARFGLQQKTEAILCYIKDSKYSNNFILQEKEGTLKYPHQGKLGKCRFEIIEKSNAGDYERPTMQFKILGQFPRKGKRWQIGETTARELEKQHRLEIIDGIVKKAIYPEDEIDKVQYDPFWSHFSANLCGTALTGKELLNQIMGKAIGFDTVKPPTLIEAIISHFPKNSIVLDSFAGSGTTAHAVLGLNKKDGGHRKFILIEMMDYADKITAERVKRIIKGYNKNIQEEHILYDKQLTIDNLIQAEEYLIDANVIKKQQKQNYDSITGPLLKNNHIIVKGTNNFGTIQDGLEGNFSYYELGEPLLMGNNLNENVSTEKIREYVYFMETKNNITNKQEEPYYMGSQYGVSYYFYYDKKSITTLNREFLGTIKTKSERYVIYADLCTLSEKELNEYRINFKKIPRDISKL